MQKTNRNNKLKKREDTTRTFKKKKLSLIIGLAFLFCKVELLIQHDFSVVETIKGKSKICSNPDRMVFIGMWVKQTANFAFNINSTPLKKFINHGGYDRYALYDLADKTQASNCYIAPNIPGATAPNEPGRHRFFTLLLVPKETIPGVYVCEITKIFAPLNSDEGGVDLVPCPNDVSTYKFVEDYFPISKDGTPFSYSSFPMESSVTPQTLNSLKVGSFDPFVIQIQKTGLSTSTLVINDNFDDDFVEMLVLAPAHALTAHQIIGLFVEPLFESIVTSQADRYPTQPMIKPSDFLQKISLKGRSGYHLIPDTSINFRSYTYPDQFTKVFQHSRWFKADYYVSKPSGLTGTRTIVIDVGQHLKGSTPVGYREYKYQIRLHRDSVDPSKIRFSLYEISGGPVQKVAFTIDYFSDERWIHFGVIISEGLLYYKHTTNEGVFKLHHTLFAMHGDSSGAGSLNKKLETSSEYTNWAINLFGKLATHTFETNLKTYTDTSMTSADLVDHFEVLLFDYGSGKGTVISSSKISKVIHSDPESRCLVPGYNRLECLSFAYLFFYHDSVLSSYDLALRYIRKGNSMRTRPPTPGEPVLDPLKGCDNNCLYCFEYNNCLVPKDGYNRELTTNEIEHQGKKTILISSYEGGTNIEGRIRYVNPKGVVYWVKCPAGCKNNIFLTDLGKNCDVNLNCLECSDPSVSPTLSANTQLLTCACGINKCKLKLSF